MPKVSEGMVALDDIKFEMSAYPREHYNPALAQEYADALINGATFPRIILEQDTSRLLDGKHRVEAFKLYLGMHQEHLASQNGQLDLWPEPLPMIPCEWHTVPEGETPKLYAISFQQTHGLRASATEAKVVAREQYEAFPGTPLEVISERVKQPVSTLHDWLSDLLYLATQSLHAAIIRLNRLGWTQDEIAESVSKTFPQTGGYTQRAIGQILEKNPESEFFLKSDIANLSMNELLKQSRLSEPLIWAMKLEGLTDQERLSEKQLKITVNPMDHWNFSAVDNRFGREYPGRLPGQLIAHLLYFFTEPGHTVVDPMAGGGTTVDVCLAMGRKCYGYDVAPGERYDILTHDLRNGWPERVKKADLIIWDPPYYAKKVYVDNSISKLSRADYLKFFEKAFRNLHETITSRDRPILAFVMSDWNDEKTPKNGIFIWDYLNLMMTAGLKPFRHIQAPLPTQQVHPDIVKRFRISKRLARVERYIILARA